jgi:aryl-alcohol dehydrogenase-like predicted oxidoreductase
MEYRKLGDTDLELSVITFGSWAAGGWMWGGSDEKEAINAIRAAYDAGVSSIDTAPIYGQGHSEVLVGKAIRHLNRENVQILTKFGMRWDEQKGEFGFKSKDNNGRDIDIYKYASRESIIKECEESLRRLGTDYIDLYQIHWPDSTTPIEESMEAVQKLIDDGKVRYAGVCNYNAEQMKEARKYIKLVSNQVPYSMVKRDIEDEVIPYTLTHDMGILAYSPLERGLLTGKMKPGHTFGEGDHRANLHYFKDENLIMVSTFLEKIKPLAEERNMKVSQLVLRWTLEQPGITIALVGARNAEQTVENAKAADIQLSKEEIHEINNALLAVNLIK